MLSVVVITPPAVPVVSLDEAKEHLRVDHDEFNSRIERLVKVVTADLDAPDGWLGRALVQQTLELRSDGFPGCDSPPDIALPFPPLIAAGTITVTYADNAGVDQVVPSSDIRVIGAGGRSVARLALAYGRSWPSARLQRESLRVRYEAGYGPAGADVPEDIREAILLRVEALHDGDPKGELVAASDNLLTKYRL